MATKSGVGTYVFGKDVPSPVVQLQQARERKRQLAEEERQREEAQKDKNFNRWYTMLEYDGDWAAEFNQPVQNAVGNWRQMITDHFMAGGSFDDPEFLAKYQAGRTKIDSMANSSNRVVERIDQMKAGYAKDPFINTKGMFEKFYKQYGEQDPDKVLQTIDEWEANQLTDSSNYNLEAFNKSFINSLPQITKTMFGEDFNLYDDKFRPVSEVTTASIAAWVPDGKGGFKPDIDDAGNIRVNVNDETMIAWDSDEQRKMILTDLVEKAKMDESGRYVDAKGNPLTDAELRQAVLAEQLSGHVGSVQRTQIAKGSKRSTGGSATRSVTRSGKAIDNDAIRAMNIVQQVMDVQGDVGKGQLEALKPLALEAIKNSAMDKKIKDKITGVDLRYVKDPQTGNVAIDIIPITPLQQQMDEEDYKKMEELGVFPSGFRIDTGTKEGYIGVLQLLGYKGKALTDVHAQISYIQDNFDSEATAEMKKYKNWGTSKSDGTGGLTGEGLN